MDRLLLGRLRRLLHNIIVSEVHAEWGNAWPLIAGYLNQQWLRGYTPMYIRPEFNAEGKPPYIDVFAVFISSDCRAIPLGIEVKVTIDGNWLRASAPGGTFNAKLDNAENESIMDGVLRNLGNGVKAVMRVDAFKLLSWFKPFTIGDARAHFKMMFGGFIIGMMNEDAPMMLDVKGSLLEYESDNIFEVGYYLGYTTSFLEEVKRNGNVTVTIAQGKPMVIEAMLERGIVARIAQAPMVD